MKAHQRTVGKNDEWLTPPHIIDALGPFDLDPCAPIVRPWETAAHHYTSEDDGLSREWFGRVWLNPPFNRYQRPVWMRRMAEHGNGIMLVPAAAETEAFQEYVFGVSDAICFMRGRPHFHHVTGERATANSGCTIVLVAYGQDNAAALMRSGLGVVVNKGQWRTRA